MKLIINCDGGSRGNPGPAGVGIVIHPSIDPVIHLSKYIGEATNNQAEYQAVIEALKWLVAHRKSPLANHHSAEETEIEFLLDSELVVEQLNQRYKLKNEGLKPLFWQVRALIIQIGGKVIFKHISREQNRKADKLVNQAIDDATDSKPNQNTATA